MASGRLGVAAPLATTNTTVYTVPSGKVATFNLNIVNTSANAALVRVAISSTGVPGSSEWIEYDTTLLPNDVLERTALVAGSTENVVVYSSVAGLSIRAHGFEQ